MFGLTAAVHGNELNGVPCIHRLMSAIDAHKLKGTMVAVPVVNTTGYVSYQRTFRDGKDLNRSFPGKIGGMPSQVFCFNFLQRILKNFHFHIDLHTASFGRINSFYVRVNMNDPDTAKMAELMRPQIMLHNSGQDGPIALLFSSFPLYLLSSLPLSRYSSSFSLIRNAPRCRY